MSLGQKLGRKVIGPGVLAVMKSSELIHECSEEMLADGIRDTGNEEPKSVGKTALIVMISDKGDSLVT